MGRKKTSGGIDTVTDLRVAEDLDFQGFRNVDDFVLSKASEFNREQRLSMSGLQQVEYQSITKQ
ncbi:MAG TPA: hypothetical protein VHA33_02775 [Candidatus Angelobacter sp.]|jgi:hypothetical protein|nr:hypothetical protein [Candidatus Angelobacter sp.]